MSSHRYLLRLLTPLFFAASCAYFNTFYNAEQYFADAEAEIRKSGNGTELSKRATDALNKTIEKSSAVLEKYPDSRFRDDALLLQGKARYYLEDYAEALEAFRRIVFNEPNSPLKGEARVWSALCKVELGDPIQALGEVKGMVRDRGNLPGPVTALACRTAAEIHLKLQDVDSAIYYFEQSAEYLSENDEQARVYFTIAELALKDSLYDSAKEYYEKVIQRSERGGESEKAHLQIVKITRIQKKWEETTAEIQRLLSSERFDDIRPQLYLELARLYEMQSRLKEGINRLELITQEFPRTETSAEAYFELGRLSLATGSSYEQARRYYEKVSSEASSSIFAPSARAKVKEIDAIVQVMKKIDELEESIAEGGQVDGDSLHLDSAGVLRELADQLYSKGELLAFHFDKPDSGIRAFERIVGEMPSSPKRAKALFSLAQLYRKKGIPEKAVSYARQLVAEYPFTEFAEKASATLGLEMHDKAEGLLQEAERVTDNDAEGSIEIYRTILEEYPSSRFVPVALFAMANIYDRKLNDLDGSIQLYKRLLEEFPESDQARHIEDRYRTLKKLRESHGDTTQSPVPHRAEEDRKDED